MNNDSIIDPSTIQAYLETHYTVFADKPLVIKVGESSDALQKLHSVHGVDSSAFVTAWNPFSEKLEPAQNEARNAGLADELEARGLAFVEGEGIHPSNNWPAEPSFLIFGLTYEEAKAVGTRYEQNAIIWCGADSIAQLVLTR